MSVTATVNNYLREALAKGLIDLSADTIKMTIHATDPVATNWNGSSGTRYYANTTETATAHGYTQGGIALASGAVAYAASGARYQYTSDPAQWTANDATGIVGAYMLMWDDTVANDPILLKFDLGGTQSATGNGATFTLTADATYGWIYT